MRKLNRVGEEYIINQGLKAKIIEYFDAFNCTIEFEDGVILKNIRFSDLKLGDVKHPYNPAVCGVGYFGVGKYNSLDGVYYQKWIDMIKRCYSKSRQKRQPTYKGCTVAKEWHNFQNFAEWVEENWKDDFALDKDILIKDNKIYSPETCCFVPQEINSLFTKTNALRGEHPIGVRKSGNRYKGVVVKGSKKKVSSELLDTPEKAFEAYKIMKECYIKEVADKWCGQITEECYRAMYNYKVEITD